MHLEVLLLMYGLSHHVVAGVRMDLRTPEIDAALRGPVGILAAAAAVGASAVLVLAAVAEVLRALGRATRLVGALDRITPRPARRLAATTVAAVLLVGGPSSAAVAGGSDDPPVVADRDALDRRAASREGAVRDGRAVTPPAGRAPAPPPSRTPRPPTVPRPAAAETTYVVVAGDCLWSIAARRLGPSATNAAVDSAWRRIYERNRAAVGDDPNLIHPGLVLTLPPPTDPS